MRPSLHRGLTLIELVVSVAIIGVLAALAAPEMSSFLDRQRLIGQAREIANLAQKARSEAIKRSASGPSEAKTVAMTIGAGSAWYVGLSNGTAACSGNACSINEGGNVSPQRITADVCSQCTLVAPTSDTVLVFDLRGLVTGGADRTITLQSPRNRQLSVTVSRLGSISLCTPSGSLQGFPTC